MKERWITEEKIRRLLRRNNIPFDCCISCHEDSDDGYDMIEEELGKNRITEVCCGVSRALDKLQKEKVTS